MASRSTSGRSSAALDPALPQKKRARRRLVGAAAVCLAAAIVLPMMLDSEPRQIRGDVEVRIPSRDTPLAERGDALTRSGTIVPAAPTEQPAGAQGSAASGGSGEAPTADDPAAGKSGAQGRDSVPSSANTQAPSEPVKPADAKDDKGAERPRERSVEAKQAPSPDPIARLAQTKDPSLANAAGFIVQIGAFSSTKAATDQAARARKAGFKAYTEPVKTAQGERVRVRVGPFATREAADDARAKLRAAGIESVLVAP